MSQSRYEGREARPGGPSERRDPAGRSGPGGGAAIPALGPPRTRTTTPEGRSGRRNRRAEEHRRLLWIPPGRCQGGVSARRGEMLLDKVQKAARMLEERGHIGWFRRSARIFHLPFDSEESCEVCKRFLQSREAPQSGQNRKGIRVTIAGRSFPTVVNRKRIGRGNHGLHGQEKSGIRCPHGDFTLHGGPPIHGLAPPVHVFILGYDLCGNALRRHSPAPLQGAFLQEPFRCATLRK